MATTTGDPRLVSKFWSKELFRDVQGDMYWSKFMGPGMTSPIQVMRDIKGKNRGDTINIGLAYKLEGDGVTGCDTLVGKEEQIVEDAMQVTIDQLRHGVRLACYYNDWIHLYNMRLKAKELLKIWWSERNDKEIFNTLAANPTSKRLIAKGTDDFILDWLVYAKEMARMARPKIRPIRINGSEHYVAVVHPYVARQIRLSTEWKDIQSAANVRGESNPIFSGALGVYDGVIIHEHEFVNTTGDVEGAGGVANNLFFGQQAGVWVESHDLGWVEDPTVDYGNEWGIAGRTIYGFKKTVFEDGYGADGPQDYGLITIQTKAVRGTA